MIFINIWIEVYLCYIFWELKKGFEYMLYEYFIVYDIYVMEVKRGGIGGFKLNIKIREKI